MKERRKQEADERDEAEGGDAIKISHIVAKKKKGKKKFAKKAKDVDVLTVKDEDGNIVEMENNEPPAPVAPKKKKKKKSVSKKKSKKDGPSFIGGRGTSPDVPEPEDGEQADESEEAEEDAKEEEEK